MKANVVICGIGGQGNILASGLMGSALVEMGYHVSVGETYGASQRGGSVMSHLRFAEDFERGVLIPEGRANIVVAFEPVEALRILRVYGNPQTKVIYDTRPAYPLGVLIGEEEYPPIEAIDTEIAQRSSARYPLPATEMAVEAGNAKVANIIMMGALSALPEIPAEPEDFFKVLEQNFKGAALELNKKAFMIGYDAIRNNPGAKAVRPGAEAVENDTSAAAVETGSTDFAKLQKCRFSHPLRDEIFEAEVPVSMSFRDIEKMLIEEGFIEDKKGGYQFIFENHMCTLAAALEEYIPEGIECMDIRVHGLLVVLT